MKHQFIAEALAEYEDAVAYYEGREIGLGMRFILEVDDVLATMLAFPRLGSLVPDTPSELEIRRRVLHTFGVEIEYMIADDTITVLAVFHGGREPGYWRERLAGLK